MVFHRTRKSPLGLAAKISKEGHTVALLTVEGIPNQCIVVLNRFHDSKEKVLITISLMVSGTDIEQVTMVVYCDLLVNQKGQVDFETYLNRMSLSKRFGKSGLAINCMDGHSHLQKIESQHVILYEAERFIFTMQYWVIPAQCKHFFVSRKVLQIQQRCTNMILPLE